MTRPDPARSGGGPTATSECPECGDRVPALAGPAPAPVCPRCGPRTVATGQGTDANGSGVPYRGFLEDADSPMDLWDHMMWDQRAAAVACAVAAVASIGLWFDLGLATLHGFETHGWVLLVLSLAGLAVTVFAHPARAWLAAAFMAGAGAVGLWTLNDLMGSGPYRAELGARLVGWGPPVALMASIVAAAASMSAWSGTRGRWAQVRGWYPLGPRWRRLAPRLATSVLWAHSLVVAVVLAAAAAHAHASGDWMPHPGTAAVAAAAVGVLAAGPAAALAAPRRPFALVAPAALGLVLAVVAVVYWPAPAWAQWLVAGPSLVLSVGYGTAGLWAYTVDGG